MSMKYILAIALLSAGLFQSAFAQEVEGEKKGVGFISLSVGVYHDENLNDLPSNIEPVGTFRKFTSIQWNAETRTLRFVPKAVGVGTLTIKHPDSGKILAEFTIDVKKTDLQKVAREIQALLQGIEGISIKMLNNKVVVDGQILLPSDMKRIHSVVKQYGPQATTLVTLSPTAQNKIAQFIERKIGNPEIRVNAVNGKFILEGMANSREDKDKAEIIAKMYVPDVVVDEAVADKKVLERKVDVVINLIAVRPPPEGEPSKIVQMVIHYVELQKDYSKSFRFQWLPDIGDGSSLEFATGGRSPGGLTATITARWRIFCPNSTGPSSMDLRAFFNPLRSRLRMVNKGLLTQSPVCPTKSSTDRDNPQQTSKRRAFAPTSRRKLWAQDPTP